MVTVEGSVHLDPTTINFGDVTKTSINEIKVMIVAPNRANIGRVTCKSLDSQVKLRIVPVSDADREMMNGVYERAGRIPPGIAILKVSLNKVGNWTSIYTNVTINVDGELITIPVYANKQ